MSLDLQNIEDITSNSVKQHLVSCQQQGNGPNTINNKLQRIRAILNYIIDGCSSVPIIE